MLRAVLFTLVVLSFSTAYAQPSGTGMSGLEPIEMLRFEYRKAAAKGDTREAIRILRRILVIAPKDCDWRIRLAEDLLQAEEIEEARDEFGRILEIEPEFHEARVGIARTCAVEGLDRNTRTQMLRAAGRGYRVVLMMRTHELADYFKDHEFVIKLLEADKPKAVEVNDPFINPLQRPGPDKKRGRKLSPEQQRQMASDVQSLFKAAAEALTRGEYEKALEFYRQIEEIYAKQKLFSVQKHIDTLDEVHHSVQDLLYPRIVTLIREKTVREAKNLLSELSGAVRKRDREKARGLNRELLGRVRKALESGDGELARLIKVLDGKRASEFEVIRVLDEFDRQVRPRLALRGTITDSFANGRRYAFFEVRSANAPLSMALREGEGLPQFESLKLLKVGQDVVHLRYRDVAVEMPLGAGMPQPRDSRTP